MKFFTQLMAGLGVVAFLVGASMRIFQLKMILHASPVAWWRAGVFLILLGMLHGILEVRDSLRKT